jgi:hypothetical protein
MKGKNEFYIAKIEDETTKINKSVAPQDKKKKFERFVSSYTGYHNEDKIVFPYVKYDNKGRQYEDLKEKKYRSEDDRNKEYKGIPSYLRREEPVMTKRKINFWFDIIRGILWGSPYLCQQESGINRCSCPIYCVFYSINSDINSNSRKFYLFSASIHFRYPF